MAQLTKEQKALIQLMGKPNEGYTEFFSGDIQKTTAELVRLGLVHEYELVGGGMTTGLTDEGDTVYEQLEEQREKMPQTAVSLFCQTCKKETPHDSEATKRDESDGQVKQAMKCVECGTYYNVSGGQHGEAFQENTNLNEDGTRRETIRRPAK